MQVSAHVCNTYMHTHTHTHTHHYQVVSTPGAKDMLTRDREFVAFKGFPICVTTSGPVTKKKDGKVRARARTHPTHTTHKHTGVWSMYCM